MHILNHICEQGLDGLVKCFRAEIMLLLSFSRFMHIWTTWDPKRPHCSPTWAQSGLTAAPLRSKVGSLQPR